MKTLKTVLTITLILGFVYSVAIIYGNRIERIENGEMTLVSESYRDR